MKPPKRDETTDPKKLLDLWMGGVQLDPERRPHRGVVPAVMVIFGLLAGVLLAKYAADVLLLVIGLVAAIVVIRELMKLLARSDLLSPSSLLIVFILAGLGVWLIGPGAVVKGLRLPGPVSRMFDAMQQHGWGRTALLAPTGPPDSAPEAAPPPPASTSGSLVAPPTAPIALASSRAATRFGEPVVFMARLPEGAARDVSVVRFYDGRTFLGEGVVRQEGTVRVAYLTVPTLSVGTHEITAGASTASGATDLSRPLGHTVLGAERR